MDETQRSDMNKTLPQILLANAQFRSKKPAYREKHLGIWQTTSWKEVGKQVTHLACGLAAMGFNRGMHLGIIGDNRPRLYWAIAAAQSLGGIPVPMYQDASAADLVFVVNDAKIDFIIAENQEQVDKVLEIRREIKGVKHIIYDDERGLRNYGHDGLLSFDAVQSLGRDFQKTKPNYFAEAVIKTDPDDIAVMLYTSGTTGKPKGVRMTHRAMVDRAVAGAQLEKLTDSDSILSYLPMAWMGDNLLSYAQAIVTGFTVNCPESGETVMADMREIAPTYYFAPPRVFENLLTNVMIRMEDASLAKKRLFHYFMDHARRVGPSILDGKPVKIIDWIKYRLGSALIYGPLKDALGLSRIRVGYTAGEAIGPELFLFFRSIGINLKQLYGSTETCVFVCIQHNGDVRADTVGPPAPGVEIKIGEDGEVLLKSPGLLKDYYNRPDASDEVFNSEGWFRTGDAGFIDPSGHLKIIDRAKDVGKLANGAMFAPKYIENKLKYSPYIKEAVAFGTGRDMVTAFINIDMDAVGHWAERKGIAYSGYTDLAAQPQVYELIAECINKVNATLAEDTLLAACQIHRFLVLHKELDPDDDEMTRTRKVRRGFIADKYNVLIEAMYSGRAVEKVETMVKFEDGRQSLVSAQLKIADVTTFPTMKKAA
jgi:long-chain acyl-CoA synthetase